MIILICYHLFIIQIAAQNCRRRKTDQITELEEEVGVVRTRKTNLVLEQEDLVTKHKEWCVKLSTLERQVLDSLGWGSDSQLIITSDGAVQII